MAKSKFDIITDSIWNDLKKLLDSHHQIYKKAHVSGLYFEELLCGALKSNQVNYQWICGSHQSGVDIDAYLGNVLVGISCKGGEYVKDGILKFSGSRTGKFKTIEEKLKFIKNGDIICSLVCERPVEGKFLYTMNVIDSDLIDYSNLLWKEIDRGWQGTGPDFGAEIIKSMSDQVWTEIPTKFIQKVYTHPINVNTKGPLEFVD